MSLGGVYRGAVWLLVTCTVTAAAACERAPTPRGAEELRCTVVTRLAHTLGSEEDLASVRDGYGVDVAWLPQVGWIVAEYPSEVLVYDSAGAFIGRLAPPGQGPGEISRPARVTVDGHDSLWVSSIEGRVEVFGPSGLHRRRITAPGLVPIEGFTDRGDPLSVLFHDPPDEQAQGGLLAQVWDRETARPAFAVGPGAAGRSPTAPVRPMLVAPGTAVIGDTVFAAVGPDLWLARWTSAGEDTLVTGREVHAALDRAGIRLAHPEANPRGVILDNEEGFWLPGWLRHLSPEEEERLRERQAAEAGLPPGTIEMRLSVDVRNEAFDGVLLYATRTGGVAGVAALEEVPAGVVKNLPRYFTVRREESGLLQVRIWEFGRTCEPD